MEKYSSNVHRMYNKPSKLMFSSRSVKDSHIISDLLPIPLYILLHIFGLKIKRENHVPLNKSCCQKIFSLASFKIFLSYICVIYFLVGTILSPHHTTFTIGGVLDYGTYLIVFHLILQRRKKLIKCIYNLLQISQESNPLISSKNNTIFILIAIYFLYAIIYFIFGTVYISSVIKLYPIITNFDIFKYIQLIVNWITYNLFILLGNPLHILLFVYISILVFNILLHINQHVDQAVGMNSLATSSVRQQIIIFCKLQKFTSEADSVFNEAIFLWLLKIIIRTCLGAVDVLTRSWTDSDSSTQIVVAFDFLFDCFNLMIMFHFSGRIVIAKTNIMKSLIYVSSNCSEDKHDILEELHHFIMMLGNSNIEFTVGNIFPLDRKISFSIFGVLTSYAILIYQLTSD